MVVDEPQDATSLEREFEQSFVPTSHSTFPADQVRSLVSYVMTGKPADCDLAQNRERYRFEWSLELVSRFCESDVGVQWRFGEFLSRSEHQRSADPFGVVSRLYPKDAPLPSEQRLRDLLKFGSVEDAQWLEGLLYSDQGAEQFRSMRWFADLAQDHREVVKSFLDNSSEHQVAALLDVNNECLARYSSEFASMATSSNQKKRRVGIRLARTVGYELMADSLKDVALNGEPSERFEAIKFLGELAADQPEFLAAVQDWCVANCTSDKSFEVQRAVEQLTRKSSSPSRIEYPIPDIDFDVQPDPQLKSTIDDICDLWWAEVQAELVDPKFTSEQKKGIAELEPISQDDRNLVWDVLCGTKKFTKENRRVYFTFSTCQGHKLDEHLDDPLVRMRFNNRNYLWDLRSWVPEMYVRTGSPTALQLQLMYESLSGEARALEFLGLGVAWKSDDLWPWVGHNLDELMKYFTDEYSDTYIVDRLFKAFGSLPEMPEELYLHLVDRAISGPKVERSPAKSALRISDRLIDDLIARLPSGKADERIEVATWLGDLGDQRAVDSIRKALAKEKADAAKVALLGALEKLGISIEEYLDPAQLLADAKEVVAKFAKSPLKQLAWFPWGSLPQLNWKNGSLVDPLIPKLFVIQAAKTKSAAASPLVRRYFNMMNQDDVKKFSDAVFDLWISEDTMVLSSKHEQARTDALSKISWPEHKGMSLEKVTQKHLRWHSDKLGSAVSSKGLLSIPAAGSSADVVTPAGEYLKKFYGKRMHQAKAVLEMLAWVDEQSATQLMLSIGQKFRTKSLQKFAIEEAEKLAERNGWSLDDLAHRTVPSGGFDKQGELVFELGPRHFVASLADDLSIILQNGDGKKIKSFPQIGVADDEELFTEAKKQFAAAKKEIKAAAKTQPQRLREAMGVRRQWKQEDFQTYVIEHPLMRRLAARLIWQVGVDENIQTFFRPLTDDRLLNQDGEDVDLRPTEPVLVAHGSLMSPEDEELWLKHFKDHKVNPLFSQLNRPKPPKSEVGQAEIRHFVGAMFDDKKIRSVINKHGWNKSQSGEAGCIDSIYRSLPAAKLEAQIETRGLNVVILDNEVAFGSLRFFEDGDPVILSDVPEILLTEIWAEVEAMTNSGLGIQQDWEKRVPW